VLSFQEWQFIGPNTWIGLQNYAEMIRDPVFWQSFKNTLFYFFGGTPIAIALAVVVAVLVNNPIKGRNAYRVMIFLPYPITPVAVAIIWQWLYNEKVGLINFVLRSLGLVSDPVPFLQSFTLALPSVIVTTPAGWFSSSVSPCRSSVRPYSSASSWGSSTPSRYSISST
jgi:ABC-type sugar transport system permease subunit